MPALPALHFLLNADGSLIVFPETGASWAGALAFSTAELARSFAAASRLEVAEIATLETADEAALGELIRALKKRPVRCLLLDLDYRSGECQRIEFEGDRLGLCQPYRFAPKRGAPSSSP